MKKILLITFAIALLYSCEEENYIPKPPSYLRLELPDHEYENYVDSCNYSFDLAKLYSVEKAPSSIGGDCHRRIQLGPLNGTVFFRYWNMTEPLAYYINNANDEIDRHKGKARDVKDHRIIRPDDKVYGIIFQLEGDVATPFQFYLTDSTDRFAYGEILFNAAPNYDSIKPTLDYLRKDLDQMLETFKWGI
jgi:gliding motility-associated lipoprotein GldD